MPGETSSSAGARGVQGFTQLRTSRASPWQWTRKRSVSPTLLMQMQHARQGASGQARGRIVDAGNLACASDSDQGSRPSSFQHVPLTDEGAAGRNVVDFEYGDGAWPPTR